MNLVTENSSDIHCLVYKKIEKKKGNYYDNFDYLTPPIELQAYYNGCIIEYNYS